MNSSTLNFPYQTSTRLCTYACTHQCTRVLSPCPPPRPNGSRPHLQSPCEVKEVSRCAAAEPKHAPDDGSRGSAGQERLPSALPCVAVRVQVLHRCGERRLQHVRVGLVDPHDERPHGSREERVHSGVVGGGKGLHAPLCQQLEEAHDHATQQVKGNLLVH